MNMYCRYCGTLVNEGAAYCKCCGRPVVWQTQTAGAGAGEGAAEANYTLQPQAMIGTDGLVWRSLVKVVLFSVLTFGIYGVYLIYQISKQLAPYETKTTLSPLVQTILCAILPIYFWYWCFKKTYKLRDIMIQNTSETKEDTLVAVILSVVLAIASFGLGSLIIMQLMINKILGDPKATQNNAAKSILIIVAIQIAVFALFLVIA